ncbi:putative bifunctional diguanylate cyclase/phosphodiesterase [Loktanella agnita]|uniref:putative bifunctional diguanylate cyclase/phosphodiesterase n=1 Tax=Loktanella agnita TaxID=287097 RepID=UPI003989393F
MKIDAVAILNTVLPFGALFDGAGRCLRMGPTLRKIVTDDAAQAFFAGFTIIRPRSLRKTTELAALCGKRLTMRVAVQGGPIEMHGQIARVGPDLFLMDSSLGTDLSDRHEELGLHEQDFSYADSTVDMLYLLKTQTALLKDSHKLTERLKDAKNAAEALARTDPLTELPNRRAAEQHLQLLLTRSAAERAGGALLHIDLDRFKNANDTLGHAAGDTILKHVADQICTKVGSGDVAARIGGDEFVIVLQSGHTQDTLFAFCAEIKTAIATPITINSHKIQISSSIGITWLDADTARSLDDLFLQADIALYAAKSRGHGKARLYDSEMNKRFQLSQQLARDLEPAIGRQEFVPYFQIQTDTQTGALYGVEVLGRWQHPTLGLVSPGQFLQLAERAKLTETIDRSIYRTALQQFADWHQDGIAPPHLSLNITGDQLASADFVDSMIALTNILGLDPGMITFELLETILIDDTVESGDAVDGAERLAWAGFQLALDDFGTGRASIASLVSLPVNLVKIDRRFVTNIDDSMRKERLTKAIIALAQDLGMRVMAEGVERPEEAATLRTLGCPLHQGFLYGRPECAITTEKRLLEHRMAATLPATSTKVS